MTRGNALRFAVVNPLQLLPLPIVGLFVVAYRLGWISTELPLWVIAGTVIGAQLVSTVLFVVWPAGCPTPQLAVRIGAQILAVGAVVYVTGWGAVFAVGFVFSAAEAVRTDGSRAARFGSAATFVVLALGQLGVEAGLVPTLVPVRQSRGIAAVSFVGTVLLVELIRLSALEKEQAMEMLRQREERFRALVQHATDIILVVSAAGKIEYASPSAGRVLGYSPGQVSEINDYVVHPADLPRVREFFGFLLAEPQEVSYLEVRVRHADGSWRWFEVGASNRLADPAVRGIVCNLRDVTDRVQFEDQLSRQAFYDPVTGLPNRASLLERLGEALDVVRRYRGMLAVYFIDLDRFKLVNDSLGHDIGDQVLAKVAERIRCAVRDDDLVARFGGDEFTVVRPLVATDEEAHALADEMLVAFEAPFQIGSDEINIRASVGVATSDGTNEAGDLLRQSDLAMYVAKENGRARWEPFDGSTAAPYVERLEVEHDLRRALEASELVTYYQPEVVLATGSISTCESLLRWQHPRRGLLSPVSFIPFAEETTLILDIDRYLMREACRQAQAWEAHRRRYGPLVVSMNLSPRFLRQPDAVEQLLEIVQETGVDPRRLQIEITERTALEDFDGTVRTLMSIRALGVKIAIDDFGTGYSSLSYLKQLPVDVVKLDRTFVESMDTDRADVAIVEAVITMGHALGMKVTAEGVERLEQATRLASLGCDAAAGFYWSKAIPAPELVRLRARGVPAPVGVTAAVAAS